MDTAIRQCLLTVTVSGAGINIPLGSTFDRKNNLSIVGLPLSMVSGMLHVLCGERPPSRRISYSKVWEVSRITEIATNAQVRFSTSPFPKIETYYGRKSKYTAMPSPFVDRYAVALGAGPEFVEAIHEVFPANTMMVSLDRLNQEWNDSEGETLEQKSTQSEKLNRLLTLKNGYEEQARKKAEEEGKKPKKEYYKWGLSRGYLGRKVYTKGWGRAHATGGGTQTLGVPGAPQRKFVFDCNIYFPVPDEEENSTAKYLFNKLKNGPLVASFGEGGIARVQPYRYPTDNLPLGRPPEECEPLMSNTDHHIIKYEGSSNNA